MAVRNVLCFVAAVAAVGIVSLWLDIANLVPDDTPGSKVLSYLRPPKRMMDDFEKATKKDDITIMGTPFDEDNLGLTILPHELPGYTGWARPAYTLVDYFRMVGLSSLQATKGQEWSVDVECTHGACNNGGSLFYVRAYGPSLLPGRVRDHENGTYTVTILPHDAGLYTLEVVLSFSIGPDWSQWPLNANLSELAYEGYMLPGFPLYLSVAAGPSKSVTPEMSTSGRRPLCSAKQLLETSNDSALATGRWRVVNKTRSLPISPTVQLDSLVASHHVNAKKYMSGFGSIGFQMDYFPLDCDIMPVDQLASAEPWRNALRQSNNHMWSNKTIHVLFIGDSNAEEQFNYFHDFIAQPNGYLNGQLRLSCVKVTEYLPETLPKARQELQEITSKYKDDLFFVSFNLGLHAIHFRCSTEKGFPIDGPCHEVYPQDLGKLVEMVQSLPSVLTIWQSTSAGWPKWGVYGSSWFQNYGQFFPKDPNFCEYLNRMAWDIMSKANIPVMDAYWLSLSRPDHRQILNLRETPLANKIVHLGLEIYSVLVRKFAMIILEVIEKGQEGSAVP